MASPIQLVTGLAGAIGCDFRSAHNQLLFVEFAGKLSRLSGGSPLSGKLAHVSHNREIGV